jgi:hypothetical protein
MIAGLQSDVKIGPKCPVTGFPQGKNFSMGFSGPGMKSGADNLPLGHDDAADQRIRRGQTRGFKG